MSARQRPFCVRVLYDTIVRSFDKTIRVPSLFQEFLRGGGGEINILLSHPHRFDCVRENSSDTITREKITTNFNEYVIFLFLIS